MACLTLTCKNCGHEWFENLKTNCPECGAPKSSVYAISDEEKEELENERD